VRHQINGFAFYRIWCKLRFRGFQLAPKLPIRDLSMMSPDLLRLGEELPADVPNSDLKPKRSMHPFLIVLAFRIFDLVIPTATGYLWYRVYCSSFEASFWEICGKFSVVATVLAALIFNLAGCYRTDLVVDRMRTMRTLLIAFSWTLAIGLATAFLSKSLNDVSRLWAVLWLVSWFISSMAVRLYAAHVVLARPATAETVALVGATDWTAHLCTQMMAQQRPALRIVGIFDDRRERITAQFVGSVRPIDELLELGRRVNIDRIVLTLPLHAETRILEICNRLMALAVDILVCPDVTGFNLLRRPVMSAGGSPAIRITDRPISGERFIIKVAEDKIIGFLLVLLLAPLLIAIAIAIKLTTPGPVLFRQPRHGYNNRVFEVLKFRTMRVDLGDTTGARQAQRNDSRVTKLGRFLRRTSLDELPQLFNVLRGDMSLVGPRPLPIGMRTQDLLCHEVVQGYAHRHRVRPGITGWAQICGCRGATDLAIQLRKRVELDLFYIENWSLLFDMKILLLTGVRLLNTKNAF
jgi:Undecaprenyl-phosphate glucose phosphotransferase